MTNWRALSGLHVKAGVKKIFARADSGFYCWEAVIRFYEQARCQFVKLVARKTRRLGSSEIGQQTRRRWKPSFPTADIA